MSRLILYFLDLDPNGARLGPGSGSKLTFLRSRTLASKSKKMAVKSAVMTYILFIIIITIVITTFMVIAVLVAIPAHG